jgi:hypothetical protein
LGDEALEFGEAEVMVDLGATELMVALEPVGDDGEALVVAAARRGLKRKSRLT